MSFEQFITGRYLRVNRSQGFISLITILSVVGVGVGVMALIVVIAVMVGLEGDLKSRILCVESHITITSSKKGISNYQRMLADISAEPGVLAVSPFTDTQAMLRSASRVSGATIRGIDIETAGQVIQNLDPAALIASTPGIQRPNHALNESSIILGKELARTLGVLKGDSVYMITPRGMLAPIGHIPGMKRFVVKGYFEVGMYQYDGSLAFIPIQEAQKFLRMPDQVSSIEVRVANIFDAGRIGQNLIEKLGPDFQYNDWMMKNRNLFSALKLEKAAMFVALALIILVAAFNIASSLTMMVMEKRRDIAVLKAMGAVDRSIEKIFIFKGMIIGGTGTLLGMLTGVPLCYLLKRYEFVKLPGDIFYIATLPVQLDSLDVGLIGFSALVICYLATLYPARQASRLDPIEAIRYG
jgi:lipoprotein-releasing system permease protein